MVDKSKTIKNATDKELDALLARLKKESELQYLIGELKRRGSDGFIPYDQMQISTEEPINSLYHYGVLGMKWGVRKRRGTTSSSKSNEPPSEDHTKKVKLQRKSIASMSNADLKTVTTRLQLEKQYKDLNKTEVSAGKKFVSDVLVNSAKQTATTYATKYMGKALEAAINKASKSG